MGKYPKYDSRARIKRDRQDYLTDFPTVIQKDYYDNGKLKSEYFRYNLKKILERDFPGYDDHNYDYCAFSRSWDKKGNLDSWDIGNPNTFFSSENKLHHCLDRSYSGHHYGLQPTIKIYTHNYENIDGFEYPLFSTDIEYFAKDNIDRGGWTIKSLYEIRNYKFHHYRIGRQIDFHYTGIMEKDYLWKIGMQPDKYHRSPDLDELDSRERFAELEAPSGGFSKGEIGPVGAGICIDYDHEGFISAIFDYEY